MSKNQKEGGRTEKGGLRQIQKTKGKYKTRLEHRRDCNKHKKQTLSDTKNKTALRVKHEGQNAELGNLDAQDKHEDKNRRTDKEREKDKLKWHFQN